MEGIPSKRGWIVHVPQQFGLDVSRLPDVNRSTRIRQANSINASHYGKGGSDRCEAPRSGDAPRCSFGRPSRTWIVRRSTILPSNAAIAGPASTSVISTKANPRDKPLSLSVINLNLRTVPGGSKKRTDCLWCRTGIQVANKDILHKISLVLRTSYARPI